GNGCRTGIKKTGVFARQFISGTVFPCGRNTVQMSAQTRNVPSACLKYSSARTKGASDWGNINSG
ncbi:MAG: hypothetical protein LBH19_12630, partial [Dysgonamonadaceae bacterium]|nr:hypothetical protein [Dysgonamonadaceae bacterium]